MTHGIVLRGLVGITFATAIAAQARSDGGGGGAALDSGSATDGSSANDASSAVDTGGGTSSVCGQTSTCANDPAPTVTATANCNAATTDPACGAAFRANAQCVIDHRKCGADGKTDVAATAASCKTQAQDYATCKSGGKDAGKG